jgi:hypothetical protein
MSMTLTYDELTLATGSRVSNESLSRRWFQRFRHAQAVGADTTAVRPVVAGALRVSCTVGIHPGYPHRFRGVGCAATATFDQAPEVLSKKTLAPYKACVSSLPTSQRFSAIVMLLTQVWGCAGLPSAGASTGRAIRGSTQSVATETAIQRTAGTRAATAERVRVGSGPVVRGSVPVGGDCEHAITRRPRMAAPIVVDMRRSIVA